jgi:hypothetical protein
VAFQPPPWTVKVGEQVSGSLMVHCLGAFWEGVKADGGHFHLDVGFVYVGKAFVCFGNNNTSYSEREVASQSTSYAVFAALEMAPLFSRSVALASLVLSGWCCS